MDIFGAQWENHINRLETSWAAVVHLTDTVIIAGDIDWAISLEDAQETLTRLESWNGTKILVRGNHDYWWASKATGRVRKALPPSLRALHNDAHQAEGFNICGAKGSPVPGGFDWSEQDAKLLNREEQRLEMSLAARDPALPTIVALHYPPFYETSPATGYRRILEEAGVQSVVYGHLHGDSARGGPQGTHNGILYRLVAGDAVGFRPVLIS